MFRKLKQSFWSQRPSANFLRETAHFSFLPPFMSGPSVSIAIWSAVSVLFFFSASLCVHVLSVCRQASGPGCIVQPHDDSAWWSHSKQWASPHYRLCAFGLTSLAIPLSPASVNNLLTCLRMDVQVRSRQRGLRSRVCEQPLTAQTWNYLLKVLHCNNQTYIRLGRTATLWKFM